MYNSRKIYHELRKRRDLNVPWHLLSTDSQYYTLLPKLQSRASSPRISRSGTRKSKNALTRVAAEDPLATAGDPLSKVSSDDPLMGTAEKPSADVKSDETRDSDIELLETIIMDIDRLLPGEEFYQPSPQSLVIRRQLIEVLYVWAKCNPTLGYKQGIHEILGLIYMNLHKESVAIKGTGKSSNRSSTETRGSFDTRTPTDSGPTDVYSADDLMILGIFDTRYIAHDVFTILNKFVVASGVASNFYESEQALWLSIEKFNVNLMKVDQLIHYNLVSKLRIESQLWIIRYLRLLLLREIGTDLELVLLFWDKLVCNPHGINAIAEIVLFLVIQLLIQLKTDLITCDFGEALSLLLHYPVERRANNMHEFVMTLYKDAVKLYEVREDDLKLYEYGLKLNLLYNPNVKILVSRSPTPASDSRAEKMKFEKMRMEMRLKKRTQEMVQKSKQ